MNLAPFARILDEDTFSAKTYKLSSVSNIPQILLSLHILTVYLNNLASKIPIDF